MARKILSLALSLGLLFQQISFAQVALDLNLANYFSKAGSSIATDKFRPIHLRYFSYDNLNNSFKVLLDKGDMQKLDDEKAQEQAKILLSYFLVGVSLPDDAFWVNLRPDSEDQIIDPWLEKTEVGKIMLEADLQLKKDTASFTSPQTPEGKEYWDKLYKRAGELYGTENITIPTLTRPWIVPGEIIVRESKDSAYVYKAGLKVMLEEDYLKSSQLSQPQANAPTAQAVSNQHYRFTDPREKELNEYSTHLIRELIIPKLTKEINSSKRYASLRQVYYSLILSRWFKLRFSGKSGTYASLINTRNLTNFTSETPWSKSEYFTQYQQSFAKGEYNLKEQVYTPTGQSVRSYVSGGVNWASSAINTKNGARFSDDNVFEKLPGIKISGSANSPLGIGPQTNVVSSSVSKTPSKNLLKPAELGKAVNDGSLELLSTIKGEWKKSMSGGFFKHIKHILDFNKKEWFDRKIIGGFRKFLNIPRGGKAPSEFSGKSIEEAFSPDNFIYRTAEEDNGKGRRIKQGEILITDVDIDGVSTDVIINDSPFYEGHVLFIPQRLSHNHNQFFIQEAAIVALGVLKKIGKQGYKIAFNSLGAFGSVNHLHLQGFEYKNPKTGEDDMFPVEREQVGKPFVERNEVAVSKLVNWPVHTLVLSSKNEKNLTNELMMLTGILKKQEQPYNILFTYNPEDKSFKVFVFLRQFQKSSKFGTGVAFLELSGEVLFAQKFEAFSISRDQKDGQIVEKFRELLQRQVPKEKEKEEAYSYREESDKILFAKKNLWDEFKRIEGEQKRSDFLKLNFLDLDNKELGIEINKQDLSKDYKFNDSNFVKKISEERIWRVYNSITEEEQLREEIARTDIEDSKFKSIVAEYKKENSIGSFLDNYNKVNIWAKLENAWIALNKVDPNGYPAGGVKRYWKDDVNRRPKGKFVIQYNIRRIRPASNDQIDSAVPLDIEPIADRFFNGLKFVKEKLEINDRTLYAPREIYGIKVDVVDQPGPLGKGHIILLPRLEDKLPQALNEDALKVALTLMSESDYKEHLKIGFNGWGAWASRNHLHLQPLFYEDTKSNPSEMPVEGFSKKEIPFKNGVKVSDKNGVKVSELVGYPVRGFVFTGNNIASLITEVIEVVRVMQDPNIGVLQNKEGVAHNLIFTKTKNGELVVYLFPRQFQAPSAFGTGVAFFELGGELIVLNEESLEKVSEDDIRNELSKVSLNEQQFETLKEKLGFSSSSSLMQSMPEKTGGIDFRALPMSIQPMGSFEKLNFTLPRVSLTELERIDINAEIWQIKAMVQSGIIPSGNRVKELVAACAQEGEMVAQRESLLLCVSDILKLEEENARESSPELKEALVIVESLS